MKWCRDLTTLGAILAILPIVSAPWLINVYKLTSCDFKRPYRCEMVHGIGAAIPPLSIITVWFADDEPLALGK